MARQTILALSIARPLLEDLTARPFTGRVTGLFNRACNLVDDDGRVIALVLPMVGKGPFAVSIEGPSGIFDTLSQGRPAQANPQAIVIGQWCIPLENAEIWEPKLSSPERPLRIELLADIVRPYTDWPNLSEDTLIARRTAQLARKAAAHLAEAVGRRESNEELAEAVAQLAGLGSGLTPAGDDYLLGTMAALWLTGHADPVPQIAETAIPKTNALSAAFLKAAAKGEFMEPWHTLAQAWVMEDRQAITEAIEWIADFGASSGVDALAGFARTLLNLANHPASSKSN